MGSRKIIQSIGALQFAHTFNPYFERCPVHDWAGAPALRRRHLRQMLQAAAACELDAIWVGRDLGYRGGRRSGLPLTDDVHYREHLARWGLAPERLIKGEPVAERTAAVIWQVLSKLDSPVFLWNVFPLHPHRPGEPFSNRVHNARERDAGLAILQQIIDYLQPRRVIAIGNDAFEGLGERLPPDKLHKVRHPSYGGQSEFLAQMELLCPERIQGKP